MAKTNIQLQHDVLQELDFEPSVDASKIGVTAKDDVVSLTGTVKNYAEKFAAVHAAERIAGVRAVTDELKVELPSMHVRTDTDVAKAALNALQWDVLVPYQRIKVRVDGGWITLEGEVDFNYQRKAAESAVCHLMGVTGVSNFIALTNWSVQPSEVKTKIENALRRVAESDAKRVKVEVVNHEVTLRGTVRSWVERGEIERAAWSAPGVSAVVDDLVIAA